MDSKNDRERLLDAIEQHARGTRPRDQIDGCCCNSELIIERDNGVMTLHYHHDSWCPVITNPRNN